MSSATTKLAVAFDAMLIAGLACCALFLMALSLPLIPYFMWKWWRDERAGKAEIERNLRLSRGGFYDHP